MRILLLLSLLLFSFSCSSKKADKLRIAIFDTSFCVRALPSSAMIKIMPTLSFENGYDDCPMKGHERIIHGHNVLKILINSLNPSTSLTEIYPVSVFDKFGYSHPERWKKALAYIKDKDVDVLVLATGLINDIPPNPFQGHIIAATPTIGRGITQETRLWPQSYDIKNMVLFGTYSEAKTTDGTIMNFMNTALMLKDKTTYLVNDTEFSSTSFNVAKAAGMVLRKCSLKLDFDRCLERISSPLTLRNYTGSTIKRSLSL